MPPCPLAAPSSIRTAPPAGPVPRLEIEVIVSHLVRSGAEGLPRDALVLVFWIHVRNGTGESLHDLHLLQRRFSDGSSDELEYDAAPTTLVGRVERIAPGAGFVTAARYTVRPLAARRTIVNALDVRGTGADGVPISGHGHVLIAVDPDRAPSVLSPGRV